MRRHREYWTPRVEIGVVIAMGPVADPAGAYGVAIIEAASRARARGDAGVRSGDPVRTAAFPTRPFRCRRSRCGRACRWPRSFRHTLMKKGASRRETAMAIEIRVPTLGESITEATVGKWFKKTGEAVKRGRAAGRARDRQGDARGQRAGRRGAQRDRGRDRPDGRDRRAARPAQRRRRGAPAGRFAPPAAAAKAASVARGSAATAMPPAPSAAKIAAEQRIDLSAVAGSGKRGQVLKGDVLAAAAPRRSGAPRRPHRASARPGPGPGRAARHRRPTTARARSACA